MTDQAAALDRLAIREVIERYTDALNRRDFAAMAALFTDDAGWSVDAPFNLRFEGAAIATSIAAMIGRHAFLLQMTHAIVVDVEGDHAVAHTTIHEVAQAADGASGLNSFGLYHDRLVRTAEGWRFVERRFAPFYLDTAPLPGMAI